MTDRELMQQALEALENVAAHYGDYWEDIITALRERLAQPAIPEGYALIGIDALKAWGKYDLVRDACQYPLAQPEQEPVAWLMSNGTILNETSHPHMHTPLYTTPPRREWQGLTEEDILRVKGQFRGTLDVQFHHYAFAIEAKLKEKNT